MSIPLLKQDLPEPAAQDHVQVGFEHLQGWRQPLGGLFLCLVTLRMKNCFQTLQSASSVSVSVTSSPVPGTTEKSPALL